MSDIHRLYYWYDEVPEDRPGGPWWYRDFLTKEILFKHFMDIKQFLKKYSYIMFPINDRYELIHPIDKIYPPKNAIIKSKGEDLE